MKKSATIAILLLLSCLTACGQCVEDHTAGNPQPDVSVELQTEKLTAQSETPTPETADTTPPISSSVPNEISTTSTAPPQSAHAAAPVQISEKPQPPAPSALQPIVQAPQPAKPSPTPQLSAEPAPEPTPKPAPTPAESPAPKEKMNACAVEAYAESYASSIGFVVDGSLGQGNSGYYPPDYRPFTSMQDSYNAAASLVAATKNQLNSRYSEEPSNVLIDKFYGLARINCKVVYSHTDELGDWYYTYVFYG